MSEVLHRLATKEAVDALTQAVEALPNATQEAAEAAENAAEAASVAAEALSGVVADSYSKCAKHDLLVRNGFGGYVTEGDDTNGFRTTASTNTLGMSEIRYAKNPIVIFEKPDSGLGIGAYRFEKIDGKYTNSLNIAWFGTGRRSLCIPAGVYYWIGFRDGNDPTTLTVDDVAACYEMFEPEVNIGTCYVSGSGYDAEFTTATRAGTINREYAAEDLVIQCDDWKHYKIALGLYSSSSPYGTTTKFYETLNHDTVIPAGSWYRFAVAKLDEEGTTLYYSDYEEALEWYRAIKVTPLSKYNSSGGYENNRIDIEGMQGMIANLAKRLDVVEKANEINEIPSYYTTHIADKISEINALRPDDGDGDQFIFITDIHVGGYASWGGNPLHSHALINKICQETTIDKVFNGGDLLNNDASWTIPRSIDRIRTAIGYAQPDTLGRQFYIAGNHDGGLDYNSQGDTISPWHIPPEMLIGLSNVYANADICVYDKNSPFQYYFDLPGKAMRYIVLDYGLRDESTGEGFLDSWWFLTQALLTTPEDYQIVVLNHRPGYNKATGTISDAAKQYVYNVLDAYNARSTYTVVSGTSVDFSTGAGKVVAVILGHTHADYSGYSDGGVPWTITSCDNCGGEIDESGLTRETGTVTEQLFDVITVDKDSGVLRTTRIGAGYDRILHIEPEQCTYTLTLTSSLSGTLYWGSSDGTVATVSGGVVSAGASGHCVITATDETGNTEQWYITV